MTKDKNRFTFRVPIDIDEYLKDMAKIWRTSQSGALIRIILEYMQEHDTQVRK